MERKQLTFTAQHCGGLDQCLKTEKPISFEVFCRLLVAQIYEYYGFDERINAHRYILVDMEHNIGLPTWLHFYGDPSMELKL